VTKKIQNNRAPSATNKWSTFHIYCSR